VLDIEAALLVSVGDATPEAGRSTPEAGRSAFSLCPDKVDPAEPVPAARFAANGWDEWRLFREDTVEVRPTRGGPVPYPRRAVESCRNALTARGCPRPSARRAAHSQNCYAIRDAASVCAAAREEAGRRGGDVCADEMPPSEVRTKNKHTPLPVPRTHTARPTRRCALLRCGRCTRTSTTCR
jgi:hypothetical protein